MLGFIRFDIGMLIALIGSIGIAISVVLRLKNNREIELLGYLTTLFLYCLFRLNFNIFLNYF